MDIRAILFHLTIALCFILGALVPFWPLIALGVALEALYGSIFLAGGLALLFDLLYGVPIGNLTWVVFPFFLFALLCYFVRIFALRYMRGRDDVLEV